MQYSVVNYKTVKEEGLRMDPDYFMPSFLLNEQIIGSTGWKYLVTVAEPFLLKKSFFMMPDMLSGCHCLPPEFHFLHLLTLYPSSFLMLSPQLPPNPSSGGLTRLSQLGSSEKYFDQIRISNGLKLSGFIFRKGQKTLKTACSVDQPSCLIGFSLYNFPHVFEMQHA